MELQYNPLRNDANLKGYWRLETDYSDESGNGKTLTTITGSPTFASGRFFNGMKTNGGNAYLSDNCGIIQDPFSMSIWVKLNAEISSGQLRFCSLLTGDTRDLSFQLMYFYNSGTRRISARRTTQGVLDVDTFYNITLGTTNWHHLVMTSDGTNIRLYLNGGLVSGPTSAAGYGTGTTTQRVQVGESFDFEADDFAVFNKVLTATEITNLYADQAASTNYLTNYRPRKRTGGAVSV